MGWFWGLQHKFQYGAAIGISILLAMPLVCAMFILLTFGLGLIWLLVVIGIVFIAPLFMFVQKRTGANREGRASVFRIWLLCLIVHIGASAGLCRVMDYLPNSPMSSEGRSFVADYVGILFAPVAIIWALADPARHQGSDDTSVTLFTP